MERVKGLDQLRFIMAVIVLIGHGALPIFENTIMRGIAGNAFVGVAAVMVFFMLSGFVIHYPYSNGKKEIKIVEFYFRRLLRIIIPAVVAIIIYHYTFNLYMGVIWSLICEGIYYILYPFILKHIVRLNLMIIVTFMCSYIGTISFSLLSYHYNGDFHRLGYFGTWIIGLPMWLLGVKLSTLYIKFRDEVLTVSFRRITIIRMGIFLLSCIASIFRFHFDIAYGYTLPIFSLFVFFWLKNELIFYLNKEENKILAYGGSISYSIYLVHYLVMFFFLDFLNIKILNLGYSVLLVVAIFIFSWGFYIIVEKPSHRFTRSIKFNYKNIVRC